MTTFILYSTIVVLVIAAIIIFTINGSKGRAIKPTIAAAVLLVGALGVFFFILYQDNATTLVTPVFSSQEMLDSLWQNYKESYVDPASGRTFDTQNNNDTTSEGESYTMLRAVWMDDQATFDASWSWTQKNLQHPTDHLFSWLYGNEGNGTEGIITAQNGQNSASDADTDIALALVFAYSRWQDPAYLQSAMQIIPNIWKYDVFTVGGKPYLGASDLAAQPVAEEAVNPSYFNPYAYRIFAVLDPGQNWNGLTQTSYALLENSMSSPLDKNASADLPPDWVDVNTATGALSAPVASGQATTFGYDALRVPFRLALDWEWYHDPEDQTILQQMSFLGSTWGEHQALAGVYGHDGTVAGNYESPAMYGGAMGYFMVADPTAAPAVYAQKLESLYNPDAETWKLPLSYYDSNIVWFGMALDQNALPDLFMLNSSTTTP